MQPWPGGSEATEAKQPRLRGRPRCNSAKQSSLHPDPPVACKSKPPVLSAHPDIASIAWHHYRGILRNCLHRALAAGVEWRRSLRSLALLFSHPDSVVTLASPAMSSALSATVSSCSSLLFTPTCSSTNSTSPLLMAALSMASTRTVLTGTAVRRVSGARRRRPHSRSPCRGCFHQEAQRLSYQLHQCVGQQELHRRDQRALRVVPLPRREPACAWR